MVKPYLSIKLKDPQHYYLEDETIHCILTFKAEKVLRGAVVRAKFIGRATSYTNGTKQHTHNIFTAEKEISIDKYNNVARIKLMNEIEFSIEVPNGVIIPSHRTLEGSDGGKIEYMIEATLESVGIFKKSIQASHIIQIPLVGKVNINENGLERTRESSIQWPKNADNANTCVLFAWIPHEGCMRGNDVPVRVEYKQPERYEAIKTVTVSLIRQEVIASNRDNLPDMTKQLSDKVILKKEKPVELVNEGLGHLLSLSLVLVLEIPSNITPTINQNAKVMRIDYKIRVTIKIPGTDHNGKDKELNVNLPIVVGTTGISNVYDSRIEPSVGSNHYGQYRSYHGGSEGSQSIHNDSDGSIGFRGMSPTPYPPFSGNSTRFVSSRPMSDNFYMPQPYQPYPPVMDENRFVLNPQQMPYTSNDASRIEGMPMPSFDNNQNPVNELNNVSKSPMNDNQSFMYPPTLGNTPKNSFPNTIQTTQLYPPNIIHQETVVSSPASPHFYVDGHGQSPNNNISIDGLASSISQMSTTATSTTTVSNEGSISTSSNAIKPSENVHVYTEKPNTFTPPQSRQVTLETIVRPPVFKEMASTYYSGLSTFDESSHSDSSPPMSPINQQMATRIDPLLKVAQKDDL